MPATVVLDILSGMPNPEWGLAPEIASQICHHIMKATPLAPPLPYELPGLGYRGLLVDLPDCDAAEASIRIYDTMIKNGEVFFSDENRSLERMLLDTARDKIDKTLFNHAIDALK